jgi:membrane fusion protein (multidrug efflux system)
MKQILFFLLILLFITSCDDNEEDLNKDISVPVTVAEVKIKSIEKYISTTGTVNPVKEVSLKSEISGKYRLLINPSTGRGLCFRR